MSLQIVSDEGMELSFVVVAVVGVVEKSKSFDVAEEVLGVATEILVGFSL